MIQVGLGLNIAGFAAGAAQATTALGRLTGSAIAGAARVTSSWTRTANAVYIASKAYQTLSSTIMAVGSAFAAIGNNVANAVKSVQAIQNMSEESGLAVDKLVLLRAAFAETGIGADEAGQAIGQMQKRLAEGAVFSTGEGVRAFTLLGINMRQMAETGDVLGNFLEIRRRLSEVKNDALRAALAMEIFGKFGRRMLSIDEKKLESIAASMRTQAKVYRDAGGFLDYFAGLLAITKEKLTGFWVAFSARVLPGWLPAIERLAKLDLAQAGITVGNFVRNITSNFKGNKPEFYKLFAEIGAAVVNGLINLVTVAIDGAISALTDLSFWAAVGSAVASVIVNAIIAAINIAKSLIVNVFNAVGLVLTTLGLATFQPFLTGFGILLQGFGKLVGLLFDAAAFLAKTVGSLVGKLFGVFSWFFGNVDSQKNANLEFNTSGKSGINSAQDSFSKIQENINKISDSSNKATDETLKKFKINPSDSNQTLPQIASVVQFASSMAKVGGGGGFAGGAINLGDLQLNESRKQTDIQNEQLDVLRRIDANFKTKTPVKTTGEDIPPAYMY